MTTLELRVNQSDRLAREARAAGLLTPRALFELLKDAMRRRGARTLLAGAARITAAGSKPLSIDGIQAEVEAARKARRGWRQAVEKRQVLQLLDASIERGYLKHQVEESRAQGVAHIPQYPRRTP